MILLTLFWLHDRAHYYFRPKAEVTWDAVMLDQIFRQRLAVWQERVVRWTERVVSREQKRRLA